MSDSPVGKGAEERLMRLARIFGVSFVVLTVGCAGVEAPPPTGPPRTGPTQSTTTAIEAGRPATLPGTHATARSVTKTEPSAAKAAAKVPGSPTPAEQPRKKEGAAPAIEKQQASPPLDLASLENRLKETKAIGLFSKIALKNQVDDLLDQFREYYQGSVKTTLSELRQRYDLLLLKVLSLLQDSDQSLATAIGASREAIWGILADRQKFATI